MVHQRVHSFLQATREYGAHLSSSTYTLAEIEAVIAVAENLARRENQLIVQASTLLEGQGYIEGFSSDEHKTLNSLCSQGDFWIENGKSHTNECFPVAKWQKVNVSHTRWLDKVEKAILAVKSLQEAIHA